MKNKNIPLFLGYDHFIVDETEEFPGDLPQHVKIIDSGRFLAVNLDSMDLSEGIGNTTGICINNLSSPLSHATKHIFQYVVLHALNGHWKISTCSRSFAEFGRFLRLIRQKTEGQISTVTLSMLNSYCKDRGGSQQKLVRNVLKYWLRHRFPGLSKDLKAYLTLSKAPKVRSTIEIQNAKEHERPFSFEQVRAILACITDLYVKRVFDPQTHLLWRLIVTLGLRPAQLELLRIGDVTYLEVNRRVSQGSLHVPIIKQKGTPNRQILTEHKISDALACAFRDHIEYVRHMLGKTPSPEIPLFCVTTFPTVSVSQKISRGIGTYIALTRASIAAAGQDLVDSDLFARRFKHTKLTHLAILGAPIAVLARAGFHSSYSSLRYYVNLTEEAFTEYEEHLTSHHSALHMAFQGEIIDKENATHPDAYHSILDTEMSEEVGSCSSNPCNVFAPVGCYICSRFQAFRDGPHVVVLNYLQKKKDSRISMGLSPDSIARDDHLIFAVEKVIKNIEDEK